MCTPLYVFPVSLCVLLRFQLNSELLGASCEKPFSKKLLFYCSSRPVAQLVRAAVGRSQVQFLFFFFLLGDVAQLGERGLCKPEAVGSSPIVSIFIGSLLGACSSFG